MFVMLYLKTFRDKSWEETPEKMENYLPSGYYSLDWTAINSKVSHMYMHVYTCISKANWVDEEW